MLRSTDPLMAQISTQKLMSLARRSSGFRGFKKKGRRRGSHKSAVMRDAKRAGFGTVAGLAVSIPLTLAGRHFRQPLMIEAGQRIGSVVSTVAGGTPGNAGYQMADAIFDRFVMYQGRGISGSSGQVYL